MKEMQFLMQQPGVTIYIVGGYIRNRLLGLPAKDHDFVVCGATPELMEEAGFACVGADFPVYLNSIGDEYALARTERKSGHGYRGFVCDFDPLVTIEEDLVRRDFTCNSMARRVLSYDECGHATLSDVIIDPFNGRLDIANRTLRHTSTAFRDDPVRVLRGARLAATYKFNIAPETIKLMKGMVKSHELDHLTAERIFLELEKVLKEDQPGIFFSILDSIGAIKVVMPELVAFTDDACCSVNKTIHVNERFAVFALGLGEEKIEHLFDALKSPVHLKRLAIKTERLRRWGARTMHKDPIPAEDYVSLFVKMDVLRNVDEFDTCLRSLRQVSTYKLQNITQLERAKNAYLSVTFDQLPVSDIPISGKQIGEAMAKERLSRVEREITQ